MTGQAALARIGRARAQGDTNADTADFTPRRMAFSIDEVLMLASPQAPLRDWVTRGRVLCFAQRRCAWTLTQCTRRLRQVVSELSEFGGDSVSTALTIIW